MVLESDFPPDIRVENEIASLIESGHEIHVACYSHKKLFEIPPNLNYTIHKKYISDVIYKASVGALKFNLYFNFWRKFLNDLQSSFSFDVVHVHDLPLARIGYEICQKNHLQFILDLHENWPALLKISTHTQTFLGRFLSSNRQWEQYEKEFVHKADQIIVVVDEAKERISKLGVPLDKIHTVSNTINPEYFDFPTQKKNPHYVTLVYGGSVNFHRGLQTVIMALPEILDTIPNIRMWIIGSGSYLKNLKNLAKDLGVINLIEFWGWKPQKELLQMISKADVAIIPHIKSPHTDSTIPHKIFQYMYAGIPILSSNCRPLHRILAETKTGICFNDQDEHSFAESLFKLLSDASFRERIPENGRHWINEKYFWDRDAKVLTDLYKK
jgi:glycosyltransferase involved in cell wall biosynthesis